MTNTLLTSVTELTVAMGFAACAAMTLYLLIERTTLNSASRRLVSKSTIISGLGSLFFLGLLMAGSNPANTLAVIGTATPLTITGVAPSVIGFGLFAIALPIMIQTITNMASYSQEANQIAARAIAASVVMTTASFITSSLIAAGTTGTMTTIFAVVAVGSFGYIASQLYTSLPATMGEASQTARNAYSTARNFLVYPAMAYMAVTVLAQLGVMEAASGVATLITTLATVATFTGVSFTALVSGREASRSTINAANDVDISVSGIAETPAKTAKKKKAA